MSKGYNDRTIPSVQPLDRYNLFRVRGPPFGNNVCVLSYYHVNDSSPKQLWAINLENINHEENVHLQPQVFSTSKIFFKVNEDTFPGSLKKYTPLTDSQKIEELKTMSIVNIEEKHPDEWESEIDEDQPHVKQSLRALLLVAGILGKDNKIKTGKVFVLNGEEQLKLIV